MCCVIVAFWWSSVKTAGTLIVVTPPRCASRDVGVGTGGFIDMCVCTGIDTCGCIPAASSCLDTPGMDGCKICGAAPAGSAAYCTLVPPSVAVPDGAVM
mmetsp:Transcript_24825/g.69460  ORF Transcript_24825/g.69460 Transcript_24825/m.69460 type:complete len:99 (+) Transcript_24825:737-1033(+)